MNIIKFGLEHSQIMQFPIDKKFTNFSNITFLCLVHTTITIAGSDSSRLFI